MDHSTFSSRVDMQWCFPWHNFFLCTYNKTKSQRKLHSLFLSLHVSSVGLDAQQSLCAAEVKRYNFGYVIKNSQGLNSTSSAYGYVCRHKQHMLLPELLKWNVFLWILVQMLLKFCNSWQILHRFQIKCMEQILCFMMNWWFVYYLNEILLVMYRKYCMENIYFNMLFLLF